MDIAEFNRKAWDRAVGLKNRLTIPVTSDEIARARAGEWTVFTTPRRPVPRDWFGDLKEADVLALASGGGKQGPILAAAGAIVTVFDISPLQLEQDRMVALRDQLEITTVQGDMTNLEQFSSESFDLILLPCSNNHVEDLRPLWREAFRVLRSGGILISGFCHPIMFAIDEKLERSGIAQIKHKVPYSDTASRTDAEKAQMLEAGIAFQFGHTLEDQIGGQLRAGFVITDYYDDCAFEGDLLSTFLPPLGATRAQKVSR